MPSNWQTKVQDTLKNNGLEALANQLGNDKFTLSFDVPLLFFDFLISFVELSLFVLQLFLVELFS